MYGKDIVKEQIGKTSYHAVVYHGAAAELWYRSEERACCTVDDYVISQGGETFRVSHSRL